MTRAELGELYHLNREIEEDMARLKELEDGLGGMKSRVPGLPDLSWVQDRELVEAELAEAKLLIEAKVKMCLVQYNRIHRYVETIEDSLLRQVILLRHVNGMMWHQIAHHIGRDPKSGKYYSGDALRMKHDRFLEKE